MRKKLLLGNWKMNKTPREAKEFALGSKEMVDYAIAHDIDVGVAPTYVCLQTVKENADPRLIVSAQNVNERLYRRNLHPDASGTRNLLGYPRALRAPRI